MTCGLATIGPGKAGGAAQAGCILRELSATSRIAYEGGGEDVARDGGEGEAPLVHPLSSTQGRATCAASRFLTRPISRTR
jgi:hypothetical protein